MLAVVITLDISEEKQATTTTNLRKHTHAHRPPVIRRPELLGAIYKILGKQKDKNKIYRVLPSIQASSQSFNCTATRTIHKLIDNMTGNSSRTVKTPILEMCRYISPI